MDEQIQIDGLIGCQVGNSNSSSNEHMVSVQQKRLTISISKTQLQICEGRT